ncbi:acetoacetate--CoA ligase [Flammeovirga sp. EKP202]|uniref:acetoacetate--CoA ligase n=1 Tax=Flammeovirga sp. EKP202 TaxID=2770592 RepID=UPI00165F85B0|nr:acetoacetate--CoA ligase [Flammeovirga sp. EKP202]MBD0404493.1 acetoacetate--CoA ligase [Flammeovirga sp. EKP202]
MNNNTQALWKPSREHIAKTNLYSFQQTYYPNQEYDYFKLFDESIHDLEGFWSAVWDFSKIEGNKGNPPYFVSSDHISESQFFPNATLNYAQNLLRRRDDKIALVGRLEDGRKYSISYKELYQKVAQLSHQLKKDGLQIGDRVAGYTPNALEAIIGMLATTAIGGVWTSCSPDFGYQGVLDRFGQVEPKFLISANAYSYNGKVHSCIERLKSLSESIPSIQKIIVYHYYDHIHTASEIPIGVTWEEYISNEQTEIDFVQLPFHHPLFIMYSSGTTGKPKCIVHKAGGVLLEHQKEHLLHTDLKENDVFFYYSTCGWMMWNWLVSGLACGCTLIVLDGSPFYPNPNYLLDLIDEEKISIFGVSAKYLSALQKADIVPNETHKLEQLRMILSTGSPLSMESFHYVYNTFKKDLTLSSISGGTDLIGAFASGNPTLPVYAGELQCKGLGFDLDVVDDNGKHLEKGKGEFVCRNPFPSMPIGFWSDPDKERYHNAYYSRFKNIWAQGDFAEITPHGGLIIYGRSDAVLNPGGVRIGTAEIYRQVLKVDAIKECIAVGQEWNDDCRVILFVVLKESQSLSEALINEIRTVIRTNATPRHVPSKIIEVNDIPKTRSGKMVEIAVRNVIHGRTVKNTDALQNPEALKQYENLEELK